MRILPPTVLLPRSRIPRTAASSLPPVPVMTRARVITGTGGKDRRFILAARAGNDTCTLRCVHIAGLPTNERFICLNLPRELVPRSHPERKADAMVHEPSGLLCDVQRPRHFATAHAVPAIRHQPYCASLQGELPRGVLIPALPTILTRQEDYVLATAGGALNAIRPAPRYHVLTAVLGVG